MYVESDVFVSSRRPITHLMVLKFALKQFLCDLPPLSLLGVFNSYVKQKLMSDEFDFSSHPIIVYTIVFNIIISLF